MPKAVSRRLAAGLLAIGGLALSTPASAAARRAQVYVLGTLYSRHERVPVFDFTKLRRIIEAVGPDVLVLDVSPAELKARKVHPSKAEYPAVVFPLLEQRAFKTYAAEPDEPMFSEIVQAITAVRKQLQAADPATMAALKAHDDASYAALALRWRSAADVQDGVTRTVLEAKLALNDALIGPIEADGDRRWNAHMADVVHGAAMAAPGKRVLALTGIENRGPVVDLLAPRPGLALVDMERWLRNAGM